MDTSRYVVIVESTFLKADKLIQLKDEYSSVLQNAEQRLIIMHPEDVDLSVPFPAKISSAKSLLDGTLTFPPQSMIYYLFESQELTHFFSKHYSESKPLSEIKDINIKVLDTADSSDQKKLIVSLFIDNSLVNEGKQLISNLDTQIESLIRYLTAEGHDKVVDLSITAFGNLEPHMVKSFEGDYQELKPQDIAAFPLLNRSLVKVFENLDSHCNSLKSQGIEFFKPWVVVLSSGFSMDSLKPLSEIYSQLNHIPVCFPFLTTDQNEVHDHVLHFSKIKPFMILQNPDSQPLFDWIKDMIGQRLSIPENQSMKLPRSAFEGWVKL